MAVRMARAGHDVSVIARGPHLAAIRANGMKLIEEDGESVADDLTATDRIRDLGPHDVVFLALKAHQIAAVVDDLPALMGPDTCLVTLQNGIPWWYFQKLGGPYADRRGRDRRSGRRPVQRHRSRAHHRLHRVPGPAITEPGVIQAHRGHPPFRWGSSTAASRLGSSASPGCSPSPASRRAC